MCWLENCNTQRKWNISTEKFHYFLRLGCFSVSNMFLVHNDYTLHCSFIEHKKKKVYIAVDINIFNSFGSWFLFFLLLCMIHWCMLLKQIQSSPALFYFLILIHSEIFHIIKVIWTLSILTLNKSLQLYVSWRSC